MVLGATKVDPPLVAELHAFRAGDPAPGSVIAQLVARAAGREASVAAAGVSPIAPEATPPDAHQQAAPPVAQTHDHQAPATQAPESGESPVEAPDLAENFLRWLRSGLVDASISVGQPGGRVHAVPDGWLLVVPRIFRAYARACGVSSAAAAEYASRVRRALLRAKVLRRTADGEAESTHTATGRDGVPEQVRGMVIGHKRLRAASSSPTTPD